jgi:hypothetical protein
MSTFYRLPVELLTIIAECAIEENHSDLDCMASPLRLTPAFRKHGLSQGSHLLQSQLPRDTRRPRVGANTPTKRNKTFRQTDNFPPFSVQHQHELLPFQTNHHTAVGRG